MNFPDFFNCLAEKKPGPRIEVELLRSIIDLHHLGVGRVTIKYFQDFDGAQMGHFIWLDEDRTSAYEESFNDAVVFINSRYSNNRPMRRLIAAKELMHVFDEANQKADSPEKFKNLILEIESNPVAADVSDQYAADRGALWKATLALIPPWVRNEFRAQWADGTIKAPELAARLQLPEGAAKAAMGEYYDRAMSRFLPDWKPE